MEEEVKLHGFWGSPFSYRVIWALNHKGVPYNYIEEDLLNDKSPSLLRYNPVHEKVPVLVHHGKPISESLIILEYIEETWLDNPLLPANVAERAIARFWLNFSVEKGPIINRFFRTTGEEQQAVAEGRQVLKVLEEQGLGTKRFFGGESINMVDIAYGWLAYWFEVMEEVACIKLLEQENLPRLYAWVQNLKSMPIINKNLLSRTKLLTYMKAAREKIIAEVHS